MHNYDVRSGRPTERMKEILLRYLACPWVTVWPGADGVTEEEVLASYPQAVTASQAPGLKELLSNYPELAGELEEFFAPARHLLP